MILIYKIPTLALVILLCSCNGNGETVDDSKRDKEIPESNQGNVLFQSIPSSSTGIGFSNDIVEDYNVNILRYDYLYNGGGVGIGDFDNDGYEDIYFTGNQVADAIYRNNGDFKFTDMSESSGITQYPGWSTGVSIVDINNDGLKDIYVCRSGPGKLNENHNLLLVNQGDFKFVNQAEEYGLDYSGQSTQAAFYDFDQDGDLDVYLMTHPRAFGEKVNSQAMKELAAKGLLEQDQYFRNENGNYVNVSKEVGIFDIGFGLGICLSDFNRDGWMDIYISNDYDEGDAIYVNQGDGTFKNLVNSMLRHTANYGMGCDVGDINNDGLLDIITLDMAFESHTRSKRNMASMDPEKFFNRVQLGWHYQYMHNMLHLNNGDGTYSEIAQVAGVHKTDWSWASLFADFDLDGWQDLYITNGYKRDTKDRDYKNNLKKIEASGKNTFKINEVLNAIPATKISNYIFKNNGDLSFQKNNYEWGLNEKINSNGAAYADLDNDGDLDLVLNNIDEEASIYRNDLAQTNWIGFETEINSYPTIEIRNNGMVQVKESHPVRGYLSSVSEKVIFGCSDDRIDQVIVDYGKEIRVFKNLECNRIHKLKRTEGKVIQRSEKDIKTEAYFKDYLTESGIIYKHQENSFNDFEKDVLLPHKLSQYGPFISKGDLNNDGLEDIFIGGAKGTAGKFFLQNENGTFIRRVLKGIEEDARFEDLGSIVFDYDSDGDNDLFVVSGGGENKEGSEALSDRLYENFGRGLSRKESVLPNDLNFDGMSVVATDISGDGFKELIIGGRLKSGEYPAVPRSCILRWNGSQYEDATMEICSEFQNIGMVTDLKTPDIDKDGDSDLLVVGEWMTPMLFINENGVLKKDESPFPENMEGWYYSCEVADLDGDGDLDILLGNLGENNKFHPNAIHPLKVYAGDFDDNGTHDIVLAKYENETLYPVRGKECSTEQMPFVSEKFETFESFATATVDEIYSAEKLDQAIKFEAKNFKSGICWNEGGKFEFQPFSLYSQIGPINDFILFDLNKDGLQDIVYAGNMYGAEVETTRYDSNNGGVLINNGNKNFEFLSTLESGFSCGGDAKDMEIIRTNAGKSLILISNNNNYTLVYEILER